MMHAVGRLVQPDVCTYTPDRGSACAIVEYEVRVTLVIHGSTSCTCKFLGYKIRPSDNAVA